MDRIGSRRAFMGAAGAAAAGAALGLTSIKPSLADDNTTQTVTWLKDRADIEACQYRYALGVDTKDPELMASAFCELMDAKYYSGTEFQGKNALEFCTSLVDSFVRNGVTTQHYMNVMSIDIDGDEASACTYLRATHVVEETGQEWVIGGHYDNTYVRTSDGWRIKLVTLTKVYLEGDDLFA